MSQEIPTSSGLHHLGSLEEGVDRVRDAELGGVLRRKSQYNEGPASLEFCDFESFGIRHYRWMNYSWYRGLDSDGVVGGGGGSGNGNGENDGSATFNLWFS